LPSENWGGIPTDTLLSYLIFLGDDRIVEQTYIRGDLCYDRRSHGNNEGQN
jgi:hypothetical protein